MSRVERILDLMKLINHSMNKMVAYPDTPVFRITARSQMDHLSSLLGRLEPWELSEILEARGAVVEGKAKGEINV